MDLNQLLYHHQIAVMRAAGQCAQQPGVDCLVDHYHRRVRESFAASDAPAFGTLAWSDTRA